MTILLVPNPDVILIAYLSVNSIYLYNHVFISPIIKQRTLLGFKANLELFGKNINAEIEIKYNDTVSLRLTES